MTMHNNLNGGTKARLHAMRAYVKRWNESLRYRTRLDGFKEARSHGVGAIRIDTHGPRASEDGRILHMPLSVAQGWRDRGDSHELVSLRHTGWWRDIDCSEKYCGHVWQLPARNGSPVYLAGVIDSEAAYVSMAATGGRLDTYEDAEDAAYAADSLAESMADTEREYNEKWHAAREAEDEIEDAKDEMRRVREDVAGQFALVRSGKRTRGQVCEYVETLRDEFRELLEKIAENRETLAELEAQGIDW